MNIEVGNVLHLYFNLIHPPNYKYCIVVQTEPLIRCVLINSDLTEFAKSKPEIADEFAPISPDECGPLFKSSWIGCGDIFGIDAAEALQTLKDCPDFHYGSISADVAQRIVNTINSAQSLSAVKKSRSTEQLISKYGLST